MRSLNHKERRPNKKYHHFLVVPIAAQGQINPARQLAQRLVQIPGVHATVATPTYSHRRMFQVQDKEEEDVDLIINEEGLVSYAAYSDGYDQGFHIDVDNGEQFLAQIKLLGSQTLSRIAHSLANRGRPVTCIVYTIVTEWAADVAESLGVPSILFWIQPAAVFAIFYRYFQQGYEELLSAHKNDPSFSISLPGLPPMRIKDLPSMLQDPDSPFLVCFRNIMSLLQNAKEKTNEKSTVLVNTFHALEADAISATTTSDDLVNLVPVGPLVNIQKEAAAAAASPMQEGKGKGKGKDLFEQDGSEYMEWLDGKEERSVVYVSFGSLTSLSKTQMEEILKGLKECGRPYLLVVRRDVREKLGNEDEVVVLVKESSCKGMVVEWCDQVKVLSHGSLGCFVTHGGWNSTMESISSGVPMVVLPGWADQATNAKMVEGVWGIGVRAEVNGDGVMEGGELKRCLDVVMGGEEFRKKAEIWKDKACEAVGSDSLVAFVDGIEI